MAFFRKKASPVCDERLSHIAFIMDGNGRWAKKRGLPREYGHGKGAEIFQRIVRHCRDIGIRTVTVYAFSTENRRRPEGEVRRIMELLSDYMQKAEREMETDRFRLVFLGDKSYLSPEMRERAEHLERISQGYPCTLNIALYYGGRDELTQAVNRILAEGMTSVTEADISAHLYTAHCPDPDLVVRTGGDCRISNFLLWQSAYAEYAFTPTLWPDLTTEEVDRIVQNFYGRQRRFGGVK